MTITHDEALRGSVLVGTLRHDLGLAGILMELNCGGKVHNPHEGEALSLPCAEVRPAPQ